VRDRENLFRSLLKRRVLPTPKVLSPAVSIEVMKIIIYYLPRYIRENSVGLQESIVKYYIR